MRHARKDYDRIQDPDGLIGEDEPVLLLRGKDACAPDTLRQYAMRVQAAGGDAKIVKSAMAWAAVMEEWQKANGCKLPDMPKDAVR